MDRRNVSKKYSADVIVVGSGAGGSVAALTLADAGKRVIIVEKEAVGGDCANYSCIPTKALLETAAMQKMIEAIDAYKITGIQTTLAFCKFVMKHEAFRSGNFDTHFVKNYFSPEMLDESLSEEEAMLASLIGHLTLNELEFFVSSSTAHPQSGLSAWRLNRK